MVRDTFVKEAWVNGTTATAGSSCSVPEDMGYQRSPNQASSLLVHPLDVAYRCPLPACHPGHAMGAAHTGASCRIWLIISSPLHLQDRWWERERESDRTYFRVRTPDHQVFDLCFDTVPRAWVLHTAHD
jgi:hypothetical protein